MPPAFRRFRCWVSRPPANRTSRSFAADPFHVGVASGDPTPDGVVLWTRLAPKPLEPERRHGPAQCRGRVGDREDDAMRNVVRRGTAVATPELGTFGARRSRRPRARSLVLVSLSRRRRREPHRPHAHDAGRSTRHPQSCGLPLPRVSTTKTGYYTAYEHMAKDDLDLVFHLGDYIYEDAATDGHVRKHVGKELESLDDYRIRHAQYKTDPLLQAMHARCPWIVTWDDHEVANDYANEISEEPVIDPAKFLLRRAAAYQAYYEMMPLRHTSLPHGPNMQLYRKVSFGRLAEFLVLDTRQYRTDQPHAGEKQRN